MTDAELTQYIADLIEKKRQLKKAPSDMVTFVEISRDIPMHADELKSQLNKLVRAKKIMWGPTMNGIYFKLPEPE